MRIEFKNCASAVDISMWFAQAQDICTSSHSRLYAISRILDDEGLSGRCIQTLEGKIVDGRIGLRGMAFIEARSDNVHVSCETALAQRSPDISEVA